MPVDPVSQTLVNAVLTNVQREDEKQRRSGYWMLCPSCGRRVVKKQLIKEGCYLCRWKGTEEEIEAAQSNQMSHQGLRMRTEPSVNIESLFIFKTTCSRCGREVITDQLKEKGCYICGWKPK